MKKTNFHIFSFFLFCTLVLSCVAMGSSLDEAAGEFEELRLRQLQTIQNKAKITPFTTDGCSGNLSKNWELLAESFPSFKEQFGNSPPWEKCCFTHDKKYWSGRAVNGYSARKQADEELRQCVIDTGNRLAPQLSQKYSRSEAQIQEVFSDIADIMYQAVRLGGQPCSLLPWRWGYGWPNCAFESFYDVPTEYSNIKSDEHVTFFHTSAWFDQEKKRWKIPIHAWVYEPETSVVRSGVFAEILESLYELKVTPATEKNFQQRTNLMVADSERGKRLVIRVAGQDITLEKSAKNGHVYAILELSDEVVNAFSVNGNLHFFAVLQAKDKRKFEGDVQLVKIQGISVISDIDDTIKITNVTDHKQMFNNTFLKNFREVSGMPELYRRLVAQKVIIHYVSSSPWQLYDPLLEFMNSAGFPWATLELKYVRFTDKTLFNLFKPGIETKPGQIEPILKRYSKRKFILIGDSGEQDPEVYGDIARRYPGQIHQIWIRKVTKEAANSKRYQNAFQNISREKWRLFESPDQIDIEGGVKTTP